MDVIEGELEGFVARSQWTRRGFVMTSLATGFALSVQPVSAETIHTDATGLEAGEVKVPVADGSIPAYRAMPDKGGPFPTVLVVHEVFGVHEHIKDIVPAPWPSSAITRSRPNFMRAKAIQPRSATSRSWSPRSCPRYRTIRSCRISTRPWSMPNDRQGRSLKLAVTGFCWGGRITWLYAAHQPELKAAVAWYGRSIGRAPTLQPNTRSICHPTSNARCSAFMAAPIRAFRAN